MKNANRFYIKEVKGTRNEHHPVQNKSKHLQKYIQFSSKVISSIYEWL